MKKKPKQDKFRGKGQGVERVVLKSGKTVEAFGVRQNNDNPTRFNERLCNIDGNYKWIAQKNIKDIEKIKY
jgi:hypothetical protein